MLDIGIVYGNWDRERRGTGKGRDIWITHTTRGHRESHSQDVIPAKRRHLCCLRHLFGGGGLFVSDCYWKMFAQKLWGYIRLTVAGLLMVRGLDWYSSWILS